MLRTQLIIAIIAMVIPFSAYTSDINEDLLKAVENGQAAKVKALLAAGANPNARVDNDGRTALKLVRIGAQSDYGFERDMVEEEINILLEAGANPVDLEYTLEDYPFPLLEALSRGDLKAAESLISTGKATIDDSLGSNEVREFIRDHGPKEIADGSLNLLDIFIGEKIAFDMDKKTHTISVLPGYGAEKYFRKNNRVKQARLTVYTIGSQATVTSVAVFIKEKIYESVLNFEDSMRFQNFKVDLPDSGVAVLEITAVYPGTAWDDTCVAEIRLYGEDGEKIK